MVIVKKAGEKPVERTVIPGRWMQAAHCMPNPWVSLRRDQLIPVNKAVNEKEQLEKGTGGGGGKKEMKTISRNTVSCPNFSSCFILGSE
jgi:hypothetical protein